MKTSRPFAKIILIITLLVIGYIGYKFFTFNLLDVETKKLSIISVPGKPYKIALYYNDGNATVQSGIQVRMLKGNEEQTLKQYDTYEYISSFSIDNETLRMGLQISVGSKVDTVYLKLP